MDQILADEQVTDLETAGDVLWPLVDHLNTVRDLAQYNAGTDATTIANHRTFDAYGKLTDETNAAVDCLFSYTGRMYDEATGLQNNLNRWYDAAVGRWMSEDPKGYKGKDSNLYRYVLDDPLTRTDPSGLKSSADCYADFKRWQKDDLDRYSQCLKDSGVSPGPIGLEVAGCAIACAKFLSGGPLVYGTCFAGCTGGFGAFNMWAVYECGKGLQQVRDVEQRALDACLANACDH